MKNPLLNSCLSLALIAVTGCADAAALPDPAIDTKLESGAPQTLVIAGGCFWGIEAVFEHTKGVIKAVSGYTAGTAETADYKTVSSGNSGHAEAVEITYDPALITAGTLLKIFFAVAHDPTQLNKQGPDHGTQYRSGIYFKDAEQENIAKAYIAQLTQAKSFPAPIVTEIKALEKFYPAEDYHQDYARNNPHQPYIVLHDAPKIKALKTLLPDLYVDKTNPVTQE